MRTLLLTTALLFLLPPAGAAEEERNEEVYKAVRALLSAKERDVAKLKAALFARKDLDWKSVRPALIDGRYHQAPLSTAFGSRHSGKDLGIRLRGADGKDRGFSLWVPRAYDDKEKKLPLLVYLHHNSSSRRPTSEPAGVALVKFKAIAEEYKFFFVAPYTFGAAPWWTAEGRKLVEWTIAEVKERYNVDENRIALTGAMDGGDACWLLGQEMPGTFSCLMPMTGDPFEMSAMIRPLFLGTLDRMDILAGVPNKTRSTVGEKNAQQMLASFKPLFGQNMRITAAVYPRANADFSYLEKIQPQIAAWTLDKKRKPLADEVDIETADIDGLRSLWLENHGLFPEGDVAKDFKTTVLAWKAPKRSAAQKKLGLHLAAKSEWEYGIQINRATGGAQKANILPGDVLLEVDGAPVKKLDDVKAAVGKREWKDEVFLLIAREVKESDLPRLRKREAFLARVRERAAALRAAGEPVPDNLADSMDEEEAGEEEEEDDGGTVIEMGDGENPMGGDKPKKRDLKSEKTRFVLLKRYVRLRRPAGLLVRNDFGIAEWDRQHRERGVRITQVVPDSLAARSGFKTGDVLVQVGDTEVKNALDVADYFADFKFEQEKEGERFVDFSVRRQGASKAWEDRTVTVRWDPVVGSRVDARWDKKKNSLHVLTRRSAGFTLYFTDELIEPGKEFHLYINHVPYQDLVDPESAPTYPQTGLGADPMADDERFRMRQKRALVKGWTPDLKWAVEEALVRRDRAAVMGGKRSFDLKKLNDNFAKARARDKKDRDEGEKIKKAYESRSTDGQG